jgi:hypothetical protein
MSADCVGDHFHVLPRDRVSLYKERWSAVFRYSASGVITVAAQKAHACDSIAPMRHVQPHPGYWALPTLATGAGQTFSPVVEFQKVLSLLSRETVFGFIYTFPHHPFRVVRLVEKEPLHGSPFISSELDKIAHKTPPVIPCSSAAAVKNCCCCTNFTSTNFIAAVTAKCTSCTAAPPPFSVARRQPFSSTRAHGVDRSPSTCLLLLSPCLQLF